ncbi:uncharacterized protein F5147DRAFT_777955 [Suillus discolor]|uniref:Uncharacterized protein n=1 Tax=Suillus discolor TaxID=1912936 RepID=A0A9P7EZ98_9AGAM|nr:uncharacterized protein F5147DRAFT_777955 [Suillus discolor]KAG2097507.1 hypothetical protein F5147DRAFT_777955 [Suillus discolor]
MVEDWERDKSLLNPYINVKNDLIEAQVRTQLIDDEKSAAASGNAHPHETTPSRFIILALMLEESQRCVKLDLANRFLAKDSQRVTLQQWRMVLQHQIERLHSIQSVYMVGIESWLAEVVNESLEEPEDINLWFPSSLSRICRTEMCRNDITDIEAKLRESQC